MRLLPWLALAISLTLTTAAEARLFWQTYGSTIPAADGSGCTWNWNQDYFVPRYPSSGRYGMYSPCKTSCSNSAACRYCHPFYPGYCNIYGPCHYRRRNHVYAAYCGCTPLQTCSNKCCDTANTMSCCTASGCSEGYCSTPEAPLYNVEGSQFVMLGSIPVEGGDLLSRTDLSQLGGEQLLLQSQDASSLLQGLPSLGLPTSGMLTLPPKKP